MKSNIFKIAGCITTEASMKQPLNDQITTQDEIHQNESDYERHQNTGPSLICPVCGALKQNGTWTWNHLPEKAENGICPACERIQNKNPAGFVTLTGKVAENYREEIVSLITNISTSEVSEFPLERLISFDKERSPMLITTTGVMLARRIAYALHVAYKGKIEISSNEEEHIHIIWNSDA